MIRFTKHGVREMTIGSVLLIGLAIVVGYTLAWPLALIFLPFLVFLFAFFRDPRRTVPPQANAIVSPADGTVSDITPIDHDPLLNAPAIRIGIFLSVFSVHINRAPCDGRVIQTIYKKGKFINALHHDQASTDNESNTIVIAEPDGDRPIAIVKQIVGLIARRIICTATEGSYVRRAEHIGMIKFGSRTELVLPTWLEPQIQVQVGQKVRGAATIIATSDKLPIRAAASGDSINPPTHPYNNATVSTEAPA